MRRLLMILSTVLAFGVASSVAFAQSGTTRTALSGTVLDTDGGGLPGATVEVKNARTGVVIRTVTNSTGVFDVPAIDAGLYVVTVTLSGFKTSVLTDVELLSGSPRSLNVTLGAGRRHRVGRSQGRQSARADAVDGDLVRRARRSDSEPAAHHPQRAELRRVPARRRHRRRATTRSGRPRCRGLPQSALSITVDGANIQDKYTRSTRRLLRQHPSEARSDRGSHGVDRDRHGRQLRPGRGADQVRRPDRAPTRSRQRLRVLPAPRPEHQLLLQHPRRPAEEPADAEPVGLPRRRSDRPARATTAAARRSSSSTSSSCGSR